MADTEPTVVVSPESRRLGLSAETQRYYAQQILGRIRSAADMVRDINTSTADDEELPAHCLEPAGMYFETKKDVVDFIAVFLTRRKTSDERDEILRKLGKTEVAGYKQDIRSLRINLRNQGFEADFDVNEKWLYLRSFAADKVRPVDRVAVVDEQEGKVEAEVVHKIYLSALPDDYETDTVKNFNQAVISGFEEMATFIKTGSERYSDDVSLKLSPDFNHNVFSTETVVLHFRNKEAEEFFLRKLKEIFTQKLTGIGKIKLESGYDFHDPSRHDFGEVDIEQLIRLVANSLDPGRGHNIKPYYGSNTNLLARAIADDLDNMVKTDTVNFADDEALAIFIRAQAARYSSLEPQALLERLVKIKEVEEF